MADVFLFRLFFLGIAIFGVETYKTDSEKARIGGTGLFLPQGESSRLFFAVHNFSSEFLKSVKYLCIFEKYYKRNVGVLFAIGRQ